MIESISKAKIPRTMAFVLKTSLLEDAIVKGDIETPIYLNYWLPQVIGSILTAEYWLQNDNVAFSRLYLRAGALEKEKVHSARIIMEQTVLPTFIEKTKAILALSGNSPEYRSKFYFEASVEGDEVIIRG